MSTADTLEAKTAAAASRPFAPEDDAFHPPGPDIWHTETSWFAFHVPERKIGGWLYGFIRPNLGVCTSSVFLYDDTESAPHRALFSEHQQAQPIPDVRDLNDFQFPRGYRVRTLEPTRRYKLDFQHDDVLTVDLIFDGIMAPQPYAKNAFADSAHYDQLGHVTGHIVLRGEKIAVDCHSMRDRSWGPRSDSAPPNFNRMCYDYGCGPERVGFCTFSHQEELGEGGRSPIAHGFWLKDGRCVAIAEGVRTVERDPKNIWATRIVIEATDVEGVRHRAVGRSLSRFFFSPSRWISLDSLLEWDIDGSAGWGEDQDLWRYDQYALAYRRANHPGRP